MYNVATNTKDCRFRQLPNNLQNLQVWYFDALMASINCSITRQNQLMLFKELTRYMNLAESQLFKLTITWPAAYDTQWAFKTLCIVFNSGR